MTTDTLTPTEAARALSAFAQRPREAVCAHCGQAFTARGRGKYCRRTCRQLAYQKRQRREGG